MDFFTVIGWIVFLFLIIRLQGRVHKLEGRLKTPSTRPTPSLAAPSPVISPPQMPTASQPLSQSAVLFRPISFGPSDLERAGAWFKEDWLLKLGALLLLIGFGWFARYAFLNNWIGPMGRIALGIIAGVLILALGWWRIKKYVVQGSVFMVLGSTVILLTLFAAREIYGFFTPLSALVVMCMSAAAVALASVRYKTWPLALASLVLAGVAPLLTNSPNPDYAGLFSYLFVVVLGTIWVTLLTDWRGLTAAALLLITFYSLPHYFSLVFVESDVLLAFAFAFTALFFITNTAGILKAKGGDIVPDLVTAGGNGLFLLAWILTAAGEEWKSLIIAAWMIVFAGGAFAIFMATRRREPFYVYAGVGVTMLAAATAVELEGAALTIAYTLESGMIPLIIYLVLKDIRVAEVASLLLVGPAILSFNSVVSPAWVFAVFQKDFIVLFLLAMTLFSLGLFFWDQIVRRKLPSPYHSPAILMIGGSAYAYALLWLSLHTAFINNDLAVLFSLLVYTVVGLATYFYGEIQGRKIFLFYGGVLIGVVVFRLLLIDVWKLQLSGRIITFFSVGALLASTAFFGRKIGHQTVLPGSPGNTFKL